MAKNKARVIEVLNILRKYTDEEHTITSTEILKHLNKKGFNAERKAVYNDISVLEDMGYNIELTGINGKKGYFLGTRELEFTEIYLLADAVLSADFVSGRKTKKIIEKLEYFLSDYQVSKLKERIFLDKRIKSDNEELYYTIDKLRKAVDLNKKVSLTYVRHIFLNGEISENKREFVLSPYALAWADDHYYLIGNNEKYDNLMHLRIDRIKGVNILKSKIRPYSEVSAYKNYFDVADYLSKAFNMFGGKKEMVTFICKNEILEQIIDRFGKELIFIPYDDNHFSVTVETFVSEGLISFILQFGNNLIVKYPKSLKNAVIKKNEELKTAYTNIE